MRKCSPKKLKHKIIFRTLLAGKLTPAAKVDVQQMQLNAPPRKASSKSLLSALVKPAMSEN